MLRKLAFRLTLAAALVGAVAFAGPVVSGATPTEHVVEVRDFQFGDGTPDGNTTTIYAGDAVRWKVVNGIHKVVSDDPPSFQGSETLDANDSAHNEYAVTFDTARDYPYHCELHPQQMTGVIHVVEAPPPTTTSSTTTTTTAPPPTTTTTTHPATTTTTVRGSTTTTTAPTTTPTTAGTTGTTTTTPPTAAVAGPAPTSPSTAGPAPTTTGSGKSKDKPAKAGDPTTTTGKQRKGDDKGNQGASGAAPGNQPAGDVPPGDVPTLDSGQVPAAGSEGGTTTDQQATPIAEHGRPHKKHGMALLLGTGGFVALLGLGALGYKWRTRDSAYWAA